MTSSEALSQYKGGAFKVPMLDRWLVIVTGSRMIDELRRFPDDYVSFLDAVGEVRDWKLVQG